MFHYVSFLYHFSSSAQNDDIFLFFSSRFCQLLVMQISHKQPSTWADFRRHLFILIRHRSNDMCILILPYRICHKSMKQLQISIYILIRNSKFPILLIDSFARHMAAIQLFKLKFIRNCRMNHIINQNLVFLITVLDRFSAKLFPQGAPRKRRVADDGVRPNRKCSTFQATYQAS